MSRRRRQELAGQPRCSSTSSSAMRATARSSVSRVASVSAQGAPATSAQASPGQSRETRAAWRGPCRPYSAARVQSTPRRPLRAPGGAGSRPRHARSRRLAGAPPPPVADPAQVADLRLQRTGRCLAGARSPHTQSASRSAATTWPQWMARAANTTRCRPLRGPPPHRSGWPSARRASAGTASNPPPPHSHLRRIGPHGERRR